MWKVPDWGSKEAKFLNLIAETPSDFYNFIHKTFPPASDGKRAYTIRKINIGGAYWFLCSDPVLADQIRGIKANEESESLVSKLNHEGRIKVLDG